MTTLASMIPARAVRAPEVDDDWKKVISLQLRAQQEETDVATAKPVRELVVTANEEALNTALMEHQIQPEKIISVMLEPRQHLAIGDYEAKYRVVYRL
jgi:hypothetical protein